MLLDIPKGDYDATWIDTKTGSSKQAATTEWIAEGLRLASPAFDSDIALKIQRR